MSEPSVLLVEDEDTIAMAVEYMMLRHGLRFSRVSNGAEAIAKITAERPDCVILDVTLPGCSGYQICQDIRNDTALQHIKVLMITARGGPMEREKCLAIGANEFFSKPFSVAALTESVVKLLGGNTNAA